MYLFRSERLGFRPWHDDDFDALSAINADEKVMEFLPGLGDEQRTRDFIRRMQLQFEKNGYCYFAVERLDTGMLIGFTGLCEQSYTADFTPCVDIGWRLKHSEWNQGFAAEGANSCLDYAFQTLQLERVYSIAPIVNKRSEQVMKRIGMKKWTEFDHPLLQDYPALQHCVVYRKDHPGSPL